MKIAIISDIHGNYDALSALPEKYDELWVLGDLVNYGPQPGEVVDFVKSKAAVTVRGNHDQCLGYGDDPQCSAAFRQMAETTRQFSNSVLSAAQKKYLQELPLCVDTKRSHTRFFLCHATPSDPLYEYRKAESEKWLDDCVPLGSEVILVGHTHLPFIRQLNGQVVVNPGSLGQPKIGKPDACYAVWENGHVELRTYPYPLDQTVQKIRSMPIDKAIQEQLVAVLRSGGLPPEKRG